MSVLIGFGKLLVVFIVWLGIVIWTYFSVKKKAENSMMGFMEHTDVIGLAFVSFFYGIVALVIGIIWVI